MKPVDRDARNLVVQKRVLIQSIGKKMWFQVKPFEQYRCKRCNLRYFQKQACTECKQDDRVIHDPLLEVCVDAMGEYTCLCRHGTEWRFARNSNGAVCHHAIACHRLIDYLKQHTDRLNEFIVGGDMGKGAVCTDRFLSFIRGGELETNVCS